MKSFRLDNGVIDSWPAILFALGVTAFLAYLGWLDAVWRATFILFGASYFGYAARGSLTSRLRSKYPNATHIWLVSIGLTSASLGVVTRMLFPSLQGGLTDYVWISISFSTILLFVMALLNN
ncbi:hypothetical protein [Aeoliella mucimassa]|uniref:hypothetical protein n=1 Tax=Aeoliella mucimassa TaxID=2527972 RepID=UPI0018D3C6B8|nr:hypothetical protein [Aeoliella mucimassa]